MDPDVAAIVAAAGRWRVARRERELRAVTAAASRWARGHEIQALIASHYEVTGCVPAWAVGSRFAVMTASATGGAVVRCRCGGSEPCECRVIDEELRQAGGAR
jgi:hypothetical protein